MAWLALGVFLYVLAGLSLAGGSGMGRLLAAIPLAAAFLWAFTVYPELPLVGLFLGGGGAGLIAHELLSRLGRGVPAALVLLLIGAAFILLALFGPTEGLF
jgi:hypothetical protein